MEQKNFDRVAAELIGTLVQIHTLHRPEVEGGRQVCAECSQIWPCATSEMVVGTLSYGANHLGLGQIHAKSVESKLHHSLQKIDERFSAMGLTAAETVIDLIHRLCVASELEVAGYVNCLGQHEFHVEWKSGSDETIPLWSLILGTDMQVRVFGPIAGCEGSFLQNLLSASLSPLDAEEVIRWWTSSSGPGQSYVTSFLPREHEALCEVISSLCCASAHFCGDDWHSISELLGS